MEIVTEVSKKTMISFFWSEKLLIVFIRCLTCGRQIAADIICGDQLWADGCKLRYESGGKIFIETVDAVFSHFLCVNGNGAGKNVFGDGIEYGTVGIIPQNTDISDLVIVNDSLTGAGCIGFIKAYHDIRHFGAVLSGKNITDGFFRGKHGTITCSHG